MNKLKISFKERSTKEEIFLSWIVIQANLIAHFDLSPTEARNLAAVNSIIEKFFDES